MQTTVDFLNSVKAKHGLTSDYQLAAKLDLSRASISRFMSGKDFLGDETAMKVAELLSLDPSYVAACIHSERAKQPAVKAMWKHAADLLYGVAAVLVIVSILPFHADQADSLHGALLAMTAGVKEGGLYIMSNVPAISWWILAPLAAFALYHLPAKNRR